MPRCAFEDIPNEILLQILQDASMQLPEQLCLSLTSRRLRSMAELYLYHSVILQDSDYLTERKLQKFLRTVVSRPELGAITRCLDIAWYCAYPARKDAYNVDNSQWIIMQKLAREIGMSTHAVSGLEMGKYGPHFSFLMHLLPRLESLKLRAASWVTEMHPRWAGGHGPTPAGLRSLSSMEMFRPWWPKGVWTVQDVMPFMSLPALNTFRVHEFVGVGAIHFDECDAKASEDSEDKQEDIFRSLRHVKRSPKLKELYFYQTVVPSSLLEDILRVPEALDTFVYEWDARRIDYDEIEIRRTANALRYHANTLTMLSLTLIKSTGPLADVSPIGSFRDFPLLKELTISCLVLLGHPSHDAPRGCTSFFDLLPSSLTSLTIKVGIKGVEGHWEGWDVRTLLDAIQDDENRVSRWRRVRGQYVPHLETFSLWIPGDPIRTRDKLEALELDIVMEPRLPRQHYYSD